MPQAIDALQIEWKTLESAWEHLKCNFVEQDGVIQPKAGHVPTETDNSAINYLFQEWDFGYSSIPADVNELL